jgi:hypothetical protein
MEATDRELAARFAHHADLERLRAENIKVSRHCADLIQAMRDHGISDETIKAIAERIR